MPGVERSGSPGGGAAGPSKAQLRAGLRAARRARAPGEREQVARALAAVALAAPPLAALGPGAVVAAYASTPTEPGTAALRTALRAAGLVVLLPVVSAGGGPLGWQVDAAPGSGTTASLEEADVVLLPALAVDAGGARLGQGGGHYDRALARALPRRPVLAAVVYPEEVLPAGALPTEPHDVRVDAALTPRGWLALPRSGPGRR